MSGEVGALRVRVLPDLSGFRSQAAHEGEAAGNALGAGLVGAVKEHWKGLVAGLAVAELAHKAIDFGKESVDAFKTAAVGATQLRRQIGGTVEDSSRLRFALSEMGVTGASINTIFGRFSKTLDVQTSSAKGLAKFVDDFGFSARDATGHLLPMTELLPKIADRFKELPDGAEKTSLAIQLFGRSGASMIRFLNQGSEGIKELEKESDKFGATISTKSVADLAKYGKAQRELHAATEGLKISIGEKLMPILTQFEVYLAEKGIPALQKFGGWVKDHVIPIILDFAHFIQRDVIPPVQHLFEWLGKHPAVLHAVEKGVEALVAAWAAFKVVGLLSTLGTLATRIAAVGTASAAAAPEVAALNAAGAGGAAAGAAGSAGLATRLAGSGAARIAIPVGLTILAIDATKTADTVIRDLQKGHFGDAVSKFASSELAKGLTFGLSDGIAKAVKSGDWTKAFGPGAGLLKKGLSALGIGGGESLEGELAKGFGKAEKPVSDFWAKVVDKQAIADFQRQLQTVNLVLSSNSTALAGNTVAAQTNRHGIGLLIDGVKKAADAQFHLTGKSDDYTASLHLGIAALENNLEALGFNKQAVDNLIQALINVPEETKAKVKLEGATEAYLQLLSLEGQLRDLAKPVIIPIVAQAGLTGVASPNYVPNIGQIITAQGGLSFGASGPTGIPGGAGHAAGGTALPGWNIFGEHGPERVWLGGPAASFTNQQSARMGGGPVVHIENWHGDQVDANGLASMIAANQRAYMAGKGI